MRLEFCMGLMYNNKSIILKATEDMSLNIQNKKTFQTLVIQRIMQTTEDSLYSIDYEHVFIKIRYFVLL